MNKEKQCTRCRKIMPLESFTIHKKTSDGRSQYCRPCNALFSRNYRIKNPEKCRINQKRYHDKTRDVRLKNMRDYVQQLKQRVYDIYGNKCACCGETNREFFAVDHISGGGGAERRRLGSRGIFLAALKESFQKEKYQLLCHNCNMSLGFFGYCPHRPEIKRPLLKKFIPPN